MTILLTNRCLLKITGKDSQQFLQSQFTNNINQLSNNELQLNAYCQHQGKIIAIIWLLKRNNHFYLSIPKEINEAVVSKLNMFKLMSEVSIEDYSSNVYQYGVIGEIDQPSYKIKNNLSLLTTREQIPNTFDINHWEQACIENSLPEVYSITSEKFIPQALNLDINEFGVSFTKGCYPGQEVVARMHYLGKPKRRLFIFHSKSEINVGDSLNISDSKSLKPAGEVIRSSVYKDDYLALATFETEHIGKDILINNNPKQTISVFNE